MVTAWILASRENIYFYFPLTASFFESGVQWSRMALHHFQKNWLLRVFISIKMFLNKEQDRSYFDQKNTKKASNTGSKKVSKKHQKYQKSVKYRVKKCVKKSIKNQHKKTFKKNTKILQKISKKCLETGPRHRKLETSVFN